MQKTLIGHSAAKIIAVKRERLPKVTPKTVLLDKISQSSTLLVKDTGAIKHCCRDCSVASRILSLRDTHSWRWEAKEDD